MTNERQTIKKRMMHTYCKTGLNTEFSASDSIAHT